MPTVVTHQERSHTVLPIVQTAVVPTPIGDLTLVSNGAALVEIRLPAPSTPLPRRPVTSGADDKDEVIAQASRQLAEYFRGERQVFDLPLAPHGTSFQLAVWDALAQVPYGQTVSYGELADQAGRPGCARAVGSAMAANPLAVVLPCHRVVGSDGRLTGFGGGLHRKRFLLELESPHD